MTRFQTNDPAEHKSKMSVKGSQCVVAVLGNSCHWCGSCIRPIGDTTLKKPSTWEHQWIRLLRETTLKKTHYCVIITRGNLGETSKVFYARREDYWSKKNIPTTFNFDKRVHYPIGSGVADRTKPDIVYRSVPVYTPEVRRSLCVAVSTAAAVRRQKEMVDVSASVPKKPYVREVLSGKQIDPCEQAITSTRVFYTCLLTSCLPSTCVSNKSCSSSSLFWDPDQLKKAVFTYS